MSKDEEIRNANVRRKNVLYLMQRFLLDHGLFKTAETLQSEARLTDEYELCDNIDLDAMYLEYASYYQLKFGKYPRILRKAKPPLKLELTTAAKRKKTKIPAQNTMPKEPAPADGTATDAGEGANELTLTVRKIETTGKSPEQEARDSLVRLQEIEHTSGAGAGGGDGLLNSVEWQQLADTVKLTIMRDELKLSWSDVCGNAHAIELIKEAVLAPIKHPQLFAANGLRPWKSLLLHGPPGSGKTLLAKVLYAETRAAGVTFFNVTASMIVSKWRGESEKLLRILFRLAQRQAPAIIFLDEIEGLTSKRDRPTDHESSKRFKNELLQLLDGMEAAAAEGPGVFILASTNLPWDIDDAFLRRFEKKMLVQLPNAIERAILIGKLLPLTLQVSKEQMTALVRLSEHFTGDEIRLACKEIAMQAVRRVTRGKDAIPAMPIELAFERVKPLSVKLMGKHLQWQKEHGS